MDLFTKYIIVAVAWLTFFCVAYASNMDLAFGENQHSEKPLSHPALRHDLPVLVKPLTQGRHYFVHPVEGNDTATGSEVSPWKTIAHATEQLQPGDTLCLRGGVYYEH